MALLMKCHFFMKIYNRFMICISLMKVSLLDLAQHHLDKEGDHHDKSRDDESMKHGCES